MADGTRSDTYWTRARNRLTDEKKEKLQKILNEVQPSNQNITLGEGLSEPSNPTSWPENLRKLCEDRKDEYKKKQWKVKVKGKEHALHDFWDGAISILGKLKDVGTVATSTEPTGMASLGWSITQLFVQIPAQKAEVAQSVVRGLNQVIIVMSRGLVYEWHLQNRWDTYSNPNTKLFDEFIVDLYEQTLIFLIAASKHYNPGIKGAMMRTWTSVWDPSIITDFEKNTVRIQRDLQDEEATGFRIGVQGSMSSILESHDALQIQLAKLEDIGEDIKIIKEAAIERAKREMDEKRTLILRWLSRFQYNDHHKSAKGDRVPDTGNWIFTRSKFKNWRNSKKQHTLWIHGIRGAGKTKLISRLVDEFDVRLCKDITAQESHPWRDLRVAFFYCAGYDNSRKSCVDILRSLIKQLAEICDILPEKISTTYNEKSPEDAPSREVDIEDCKIMLNDTIRHHSNILLILDALDECDEKSIQGLLSVFNEITRQQNPHLRIKIIIASRDLPAITNRLGQSGNIVISELDNRGDIKRFIERRLTREDTSKVPPQLQAKIVTVLSNKSRAMFQYAAVHLENILELPTADDIENALESPPKDLVEVYRKTFAIIKSDLNWGPYVMRAFAWILARGGGSSRDHLVAAASQKPEHIDRLPNSVVHLDELLKASRFMLTFDHGDHVRFSHLSVQDYLEGEEERETLDIAPMVFLRTLLNYDSCKETQPSQVFHLYDNASSAWWTYVKKLEDRERIQPFLDRVLELNLKRHDCPRWQMSLASWTVTMFSLGYFGRDDEDEKPIESIFPSDRSDLPGELFGASSSHATKNILEALAVGCFIRLRPAMKAFFTSGSMGNTRLLNHTPLPAYRSPEGHENQENLGDAKETENRRITAALGSENEQRTSTFAHWYLPCLLLLNFVSKIIARIFHPRTCVEISNGTVEQPWQLRDTFLHVARAIVQGPPEDILHLYESSHNIPSGFMEELARVIILAVTYWGRISLNTFDIEYKLALIAKKHFAKVDGRPLQYHYFFFGIPNLKVTRSLAYFRNIPNRPGIFHQPDIIKFLILNGADVNFCRIRDGWVSSDDGRFDTPLMFAVKNYGSHGAEIMEMLLKNGADVNKEALSGSYGTALIAACALGIEDVVKLLLKLGEIDVNLVASFGKYGTALIAACASPVRKQDNRIVEMLLDSGADPRAHARCGIYTSAFAAALYASRAPIVVRMLNYGNGISEDTKKSLQIIFDGLFKLQDLFDDKLNTSDLRSIAHTLERKVTVVLLGRHFISGIPKFIRWTYDLRGVTVVASLSCSLKCIRFSNRSLVHPISGFRLEAIEGCRREAAKFLSCLSSCMGGLHTAKLILFCFGYLNQDTMVVEAWRKVLSESESAGEDYDWKFLADFLRDLILKIPRPTGARDLV
ncbi:hypothetical protein F4805DRAFT_422935 [Annulohypoxylon moriforme]|nr:hypothetical protein F4805DRAFT_422935 [Annulohypoxylon moriforme]